MGAENVVNAINNDTLTVAQRNALLVFLQERRDALQESIDEINAAIQRLEEGPPDDG